MRNFNYFRLLILIFCIALPIFATYLGSRAKHEALNQKEMAKIEAIQPQSFKNGVCYFPCVDKKFGKSLSEYLENNKYLEFVDMEKENKGYWVIFKEK